MFNCVLKSVSKWRLHGRIIQIRLDSNSNSNLTFIVLNLPIQEDSKVQQNQKSSCPNFSIQRQKRGQAPQRMPGDDPG